VFCIFCDICKLDSSVLFQWVSKLCGSFPFLFQFFSVIKECVPRKYEGINQNCFINVPVGAALYPLDLIAFLALPYFSVAVLRLPAFSCECLIASTADYFSCKEISY
jgi:hypothetical protein